MHWFIGTLLLMTATYLEAAAPIQLRCEYLESPQGISETVPRLSWQLPSGERGQRQTAYQVLVAGTEALLKKEQGNIWDSGKVPGDQSIHVRYAGAALKAGQACYWKVRVWDKDGKPSNWSATAQWNIGPLQLSDWHAQWIGLDEVVRKEIITDTQWIWYPERPEPPGTRYFRRTLMLPSDRTIKSARILVAADNLSVIYCNGEQIGRANHFNTAAEFNLAGRLKPGKNVLAASVQNLGDAPNPAGLLVLLKIEFAQGEPMVVTTDAAWKSANTEISGWEQTAFDDNQWVLARIVGPVGMKPWGETSAPEDRRLPARWLRKRFELDRKVQRATVHLSGLGLSELYLNGRKVGTDVLSPGLTEYPKRVLYVTHDVTDMVQRGDNAIGVVLGNGRFFAPRSRSPMTTAVYGYPKLLLQMRVEFTDGTATEIVSDGSWKLTTEGPIRANNEYDGEEYDARMELGDWSNPDYSDATWQRVWPVAAPEGKLVAQMIPPIRVTGGIKPMSVKSPQPGMYVFDMGQNMVGWCRLKVKGPAGTAISLRHAEVLKPDGTLYLDNIRDAKVTDRYTLKGEGTELWEPCFTYHGFRYVEVRGWPGMPTLDSLEGRVVNDDLATAGEWSCSNPLLNRIYTNIVWGVRGNYRSIPTDCPQRDERQGWLGDRSAECKGEAFLFHNAALYAKWAQDIVDAQKETGSVPDVAPPYWPIYSDNVTWPSSLILVPGALYEQFGDLKAIESAYPAMVKWMTYMSGFITNNLMPKDRYGDWCVPPENPKLIHSTDPARKTAPTVIGTTYFHLCSRLMQRYATLLGKTEEAQRYGELAERLKTAFNKEFYRADSGCYDNGSQTACVLPLMFEMVPAEQRARVFGRLVDKISRESNDHVGTGLIGGQWLMRTLSDNGRPDLAYTLASQKTYPSWGYMVEKDASTIWELWNGDTADPAMNSGNHVMLVGDMVIWYYEYLAGIQSDPVRPGFKHILMRPHLVGDLTWVKATHRSPYGLVASHWQKQNINFEWAITVPPNTTATIFVPVRADTAAMENGKPADRNPGMKFLRMESGVAVYDVQPGSYAIRSVLPTSSRPQGK